VTDIQGTNVQNAIYVSGECEWPVAPEEWEALAREKIDAGASTLHRLRARVAKQRCA
jgi:hypothetical protein